MTETKRIMLVDDHVIFRQSLKMLLETHTDYKVCWDVGDVQSAIEQLQVVKPDLLIVDISLKGVSGLTLTAAVREKCPDIPVLILSMYSENVYAERAFQMGAKGYIMKNAAMEELLTAVKTVMNGRIFASEFVKDQVLLSFSKTSRGNRTKKASDSLTDRELEILHLLGQGRKTRQIASILKVSPKTIDSHCMNIKTKLNLRDSGALMEYAVLWHYGREW